MTVMTPLHPSPAVAATASSASSAPHRVPFTRLPRHVGLAAAANASTPSLPAAQAVDVEAERRLAYQQGYDEAATFLNQQLFLQRRDVVALADETLARLGRQEETLAAQAREVLPDLVMEVVRRLWAGFQPDAALVRRLVGEALANVAPGPGRVEVALPPADLALLDGADAGLRERHPGLEFRADPGLRPGDCLVRSRFGLTDARTETKLRTIETMLRAA